MLRHCDDLIDRVTKARYHAVLAALCPDITIPSAVDEQNSPSEADRGVRYRSATKRLIEMRRGPDYQMLHHENASYGFRRNMLGLKPIAHAVAGIAALVTALGWWTVVSPSPTWQAVQATIVTYPHLPVLLAFDVGYFLLWAVMINKNFVRQYDDSRAKDRRNREQRRVKARHAVVAVKEFGECREVQSYSSTLLENGTGSTSTYPFRFGNPP